MVRGAMVLLGLAAATPALAQGMPAMVPIATPAQPGAIPLETRHRAPAQSLPESWFLFDGQRTVRNVSVGTLTPVLPAPGTETGAAVIVAPGGGFLMLSMENEGWPVARWLADHGIAAFVLKYRLTPTPADASGFGRTLGAMFADAAAGRLHATADAVKDAEAALRLVRAGSAAWHVDPRRVGLVGFSAGAVTALQVTLAHPPGATPDFVAPIYGPMSTVAVAADAPPLFAALAIDDPLFSRADYGLIDAWHRAGRPVELHLYETGGHGFGMGKVGTTSNGWIAQFYAWMEVGGWLARRP